MDSVAMVDSVVVMELDFAVDTALESGEVSLVRLQKNSMYIQKALNFWRVFLAESGTPGSRWHQNPLRVLLIDPP